MNELDRVCMWLAVLIIVVGFFLAFIRIRNYWYDMTGFDPLAPWRRS